MKKESAPIRLARALHWLSYQVHQTAQEKGWWPQDRNNGELIALCHSELSEAYEGSLNGNPPDDKVPEFTSWDAEFADAIIRILDMNAARKWNIHGIVSEIVFNDPLAVANQTEIPVGSSQEFQAAWSVAVRRSKKLELTPKLRVTKKNDAEIIAMMHLKLSMALEALRKPTHAEVERSGVETELALAVIIAMKVSCTRKTSLAEAILAKAEMNKTREIKHGGKAF